MSPAACRSAGTRYRTETFSCLGSAGISFKRSDSNDRLLHNPVEDAVKICSDIVILEGNYLLLDM